MEKANSNQSKSTSSFNISLPKNWLPKNWVEISRDSSEMQILFKLGHINPEDIANPLLTSGNPVANVGGEAVSVHGIESRGTMTKFFETMTKFAETGLMKGYTPEKIKGIRKQFNTLRDEKFDMSANIAIIRYDNATITKQALEQQLAMRTGGFADLKLPGMDGKSLNYLDHPEVKKHMSAEQQKLLKTMMTTVASEYKEKTAEVGMKTFLSTEFGYPAVITEMDNPEYLRQEEAKKKPKYVPPKNRVQMGGFDPLAGKGILPQKPKPAPPSKKIRSCLAIQVGRYVLTGDLLGMLEMLPKGSTFHESLTNTKTYVEKEIVEGKEYTTKHLIPVASTYLNEGYANQEQAQTILRALIDSIKDKN